MFITFENELQQYIQTICCSNISKAKNAVNICNLIYCFCNFVAPAFFVIVPVLFFFSCFKFVYHSGFLCWFTVLYVVPYT